MQKVSQDRTFFDWVSETFDRNTIPEFLSGPTHPLTRMVEILRDTDEKLRNIALENPNIKKLVTTAENEFDKGNLSKSFAIASEFRDRAHKILSELESLTNLKESITKVYNSSFDKSHSVVKTMQQYQKEANLRHKLVKEASIINAIKKLWYKYITEQGRTDAFLEKTKDEYREMKNDLSIIITECKKLYTVMIKSFDALSKFRNNRNIAEYLNTVNALAYEIKQCNINYQEYFDNYLAGQYKDFSTKPEVKALIPDTGSQPPISDDAPNGPEADLQAVDIAAETERAVRDGSGGKYVGDKEDPEQPSFFKNKRPTTLETNLDPEAHPESPEAHPELPDAPPESPGAPPELPGASGDDAAPRSEPGPCEKAIAHMRQVFEDTVKEYNETDPHFIKWRKVKPKIDNILSEIQAIPDTDRRYNQDDLNVIKELHEKYSKENKEYHATSTIVEQILNLLPEISENNHRLMQIIKAHGNKSPRFLALQLTKLANDLEYCDPKLSNKLNAIVKRICF